MSNLILITGGCRSGKSRYALEKADQLGPKIVYVATGEPSDSEMRERILRHQKERPPNWVTVENRWDLTAIFKEHQHGFDGFLIDCLTLWSSHFLLQRFSEDQVADLAREVVESIASLSLPVIAVTNEVGWGVVPETSSGRLFRDFSGRVNQAFAKAADEVVLMVSGIPVIVKNQSMSEVWNG